MNSIAESDIQYSKKEKVVTIMYQKRCNGIIHEVKKGDTLYTISREHNVPLESVMLANPDVDIYNLQIGSKVCVPAKCVMKPVYSCFPVNKQMPDGEMGMNGYMDVRMNADTGMDMNADMGRDMSADMGRDMSADTGMDMNADMSEDTGMNMNPIMESVNTSRNEKDTIAYIVRDGDSMEHIMKKFGVSLEDISENNANRNLLFKPGITIIIPNK